jgi:hypothetical protein
MPSVSPRRTRRTRSNAPRRRPVPEQASHPTSSVPPPEFLSPLRGS